MKPIKQSIITLVLSRLYICYTFIIIKKSKTRNEPSWKYTFIIIHKNEKFTNAIIKYAPLY